MSHPWTLVYDGQCGFCRHWVDALRRWDRAGRVRAVPLQDAAAWGDLPGLTLRGLEQSVHLVSPDGQVFAGAEAAPPLFSLLPGGWLLAWPLRLPLAGRLAAAGYRWIARHRHRDGCGSAACRRGD